MARSPWLTIFVVVAAVASSVPAALAQREAGRWAGRFEGPLENFDTPDALKLLTQDCADGRFADAAARVEALLKDHADDRVAVDELALQSIACAVDVAVAALPADQRRGLQAEYRRLYDEPARLLLAAELDSVARRQPVDAGVEALVAIARRYPFSSVAAEALADAARRAARTGDVPAALDLLSLAAARGFPVKGADEALLRAARDFVAAQERPGPAATYRGPVPFDAPWFGREDAVHLSRHLPAAVDGTIYLAGPRRAFAFRADGSLLWQWRSAETWANTTVDRPPGRGRGPVFAPASFTSAAAGAQVLVLRQPRGTSREFCLRALRAADGRLLWSTEATPALDRVSFASSPLVRGRYVYAVAVEFTDEEATVTVVALDLLDGRVMFKSPLGTLLAQRRARAEIAGWDEFWEQTEPAADADTLYVTPNVGGAFALDRFSGQLRWARDYDPPSATPPRGGRRERRPEWFTRRTPTDPAELFRGSGTPAVAGDALVIAPQDGPMALGLDARSGRVLWRAAAPPGHTLVGIAGAGAGADAGRAAGRAADRRAIFAGPGVAALDASTGEPRWTWSPPAGRKLSGPPVLLGGTLHLPVGDQVITLDATTGDRLDDAPAPPTLAPVLANAESKKALAEAGMLSTLSR